jgi:hypothetical protein
VPSPSLSGRVSCTLTRIWSTAIRDSSGNKTGNVKTSSSVSLPVWHSLSTVTTVYFRHLVLDGNKPERRNSSKRSTGYQRYHRTHKGDSCDAQTSCAIEVWLPDIRASMARIPKRVQCAIVRHGLNKGEFPRGAVPVDQPSRTGAGGTVVRHRRGARGEQACGTGGTRSSEVCGAFAEGGPCDCAAIAGASERSNMNRTGHRNVQMVRRYIRDGSLFRENSGRKFGLESFAIQQL